MKLLSFFILPLTLVALLPTAATAETGGAAGDGELTFGDRIGITVHFNQGQTHDHLQDLLTLGVKWIRDSENWKVVEQSPGEYVFPERFKQRLAFYREHDIAVCYGLWYGNPVAYPDAPFDPEHYGDYAAAVTRMLNDAGVEFVLEIWNEPHNFALGKYFGGNGNARPPSPWADRYVELVHAAVKAAKAVDPDVKLLTNEDYLVAHYWFLEQGLPKELDGFAIHPYVHGPSPGPEQTSYGPDVEWATPFTVIDDDRSFRSMVRRVRDQYESKLGHPMEVWVTEWGYRLGKRMSHEDEEARVTEEIAAAFLPRLYILSVSAGARVVMWHNLQDLKDGPYGLIRNSGEHRLAYDSMKTMSEQLGEMRLVKHLVGADHPTTGVQAYLFEGPMGHKVVAWTVEEAGAQVRVDTASSAPLKVAGLTGESVDFEYEDDGLPIVSLSREPVYLSGVLDDVALLATEAGQ